MCFVPREVIFYYSLDVSARKRRIKLNIYFDVREGVCVSADHAGCAYVHRYSVRRPMSRFCSAVDLFVQEKKLPKDALQKRTFDEE